MASLCRECKERVKWTAQRCPFCGETNPAGVDRTNVWVVLSIIAGSIVTAFVFFLMWIDQLVRGLSSRP